MSKRLSNWKGTATPDTPGYVHFFCSVTKPHSGVTVVFTDEPNVDSRVFTGKNAAAVGFWRTTNMLEADEGLASIIGIPSTRSLERPEVRQFDLHEKVFSSEDDAVALKLIRGAISSFAHELMDLGLNIEAYDARPHLEDSSPVRLGPLPQGAKTVAQPRLFDSEIESVIEFVAEEMLVYYLKCPTTADQKRNARFKTIVFTGYRAFYKNKAALADGPLKLIDILENTSVAHGSSFEIKTNSGSRFIAAREAYVTRSSTM